MGPTTRLYGGAAVLLVGATLMAGVGWLTGREVGGSPYAAATLTRQHTDYRTVTRRVRGRVVTLPGEGAVLIVPRIIMRTRTRIVTLPAHEVPLTSISATAALAQPDRPVTVYVRVPVPTTITTTTTETVTDVHTTTETATITVTLPIEPGP